MLTIRLAYESAAYFFLVRREKRFRKHCPYHTNRIQNRHAPASVFFTLCMDGLSTSPSPSSSNPYKKEKPLPGGVFRGTKPS
jgi:hypothetical protein